MANPTTNFGWVMPSSSSLVTNLPADFNTFGQAVDTSMSELLGGTTGQVLSKTSNTNMDFTWVTTDDANAIQNSIVNAKGDLIGASANDVPAILSVGNNGETLVADSSTSTGLRYQGSMTAGKNAVVNGGMDIWQRGTSFTTGSAYTADRWYGGTMPARTISRQVTGDTTNLPFIQYCMRVQRNSGSTNTTTTDIGSPVETNNAVPYAGKAITFSYYARAGANFSAASSNITVSLYTGTGTDQNAFVSYTGVAQPINTTSTLTTTWQRFQHTITLGSTVTEFMPYFGYSPVGTAGANDYFEVTGVQIEVGSIATQFSRAGATIQGELAACRRYLPAFSGGLNALSANFAGYAYATNSSAYSIPFDVPARVSPTGITVSGTINAIALNTQTSVTPTFNCGSAYNALILASHTITAGQGTRLELSSNSLILFTGCEL